MLDCRQIRFALLFPLLAAVLGAPTVGRSAEAGQARPNILFILSDDQRWDMMGHVGHFPIQTPNMDRLAAEGTRFRNMFVTTAICAASRATILTGLYERTHRYTFGTKPISSEHAAASYPRLLRDAGYRTGHVGKFGVGVADPDESKGDDVKGGGERLMYDVFTSLNRNPYFKKQPDGSEKHLTDIETDAAIDFIKSAKPGQPWCLSLCFNAPHAEDNDPRQYIWSHASDNLYSDLHVEPPASMSESFFESQPPFLKNSESRVRFKWRWDEPAKYQEMIRGYFRMISDVDRGIGRVRQALADLGIADNTIVIFTADNGYFIGDRGFADKWYIYEESIRVPLLVVDPRSPGKGRVNDDTVLNVDLSPTILDFAGVAAPKHYQGTSLRPLVAGSKPASWRDDFLYEHLMDANGPGSGSANPNVSIPKSEGVRNERFTYVRWFEQKPLVEELYDHEADFHCTNNLIADPAFAKTLEELRARTTELRDQYGGPWVSNAAPKPDRPAKKAKGKADGKAAE